jgi:hypothetical protein
MHRYRMKTTFLERLLGTADEWLRPFASVTPDPAGEESGGGGGEELDTDDPSLGEAGQKALKTEREARKALERQMAQLQQQLAAVKDLNPDAYRAAQEKANELERRLAERDQLTAAERQRIEAKSQQQITAAKKEAEAERAKRIDLQTRTLARGVFSAAEGRDGADSGGLTFFDAYFEFQGRRHFRVDEATGKLFVVDGDGDRIKTAEGQDVDPVTWLNQQADTSPVIGSFFKPKGGVGSGGLSGARGVRGVQGMSPEDIKKLSPSQKMALHRQGRTA